MVYVDGNGIPLTLLTESAQISEVKLALPTIDRVSIERRANQPRKRLEKLVADKGYDAMWLRQALAKKGIKHRIPKRRARGFIAEPKYNNHIKADYCQRWIVERTISWLGNYRRLLIRWENNENNYEALLEIACSLICLRRVLK